MKFMKCYMAQGIVYGCCILYYVIVFGLNVVGVCFGVIQNNIKQYDFVYCLDFYFLSHLQNDKKKM